MKVRVPAIEMEQDLFVRLNEYVDTKQREAVEAGRKRLEVNRQKVIEIAVKEFLDRQEKRAKQNAKRKTTD